jgi:predicted O-methyltransferase YrrM
MKKFAVRYFLTLLLAIRTFTLGLFIAKYRKYIWILSVNSGIAKIVGDNEEQLSFDIPVLNPENLVQCFDQKLISPVGSDGNITTLELLLLNYFISKNNPLRIFEIGTFNGRTTINFAVNSKPETIIYTLDILPEQIHELEYNIEEIEKKYINKSEIGELYKKYNSSEKNKIIQLYGDSAKFDFSPFYNNIDYVFIDGSHHYDYVKNDTEIALKIINRNSGIIFWHDYNECWRGVIKALNELYHENKNNNIWHIKGTSLVFLQF